MDKRRETCVLHARSSEVANCWFEPPRGTHIASEAKGETAVGILETISDIIFVEMLRESRNMNEVFEAQTAVSVSQSQSLSDSQNDIL